MVRLHAERERFLAVMESLPRTLCHLDVWPHNMFARDDVRTALVDWAFVGDGALGEDVGNLIPDSVFDLFQPADRLTELDELVYGSYVEGVRAAGWSGDERLVRLAVCASAVKYDWLVPLMLGQATAEEHADYGGVGAVSSARRYRERGATFAFLAEWAEEARELAHVLGV
jgi:thiamine kinase-like enzyme